MICDPRIAIIVGPCFRFTILWRQSSETTPLYRIPDYGLSHGYYSTYRSVLMAQNPIISFLGAVMCIFIQIHVCADTSAI